ncbi:hypothetical protein BASA61_005766 [Batrachochytrium salamandrivorans]|nr:hypothetical protein BASA61_005766 [Batrachochytrium salamandrivorans]KAH9247303.1 hypothetical protein BASA81_015105 [Batrachochytrium salamandrivorans]
MTREESEPYLQIQENDDYRQFIECEDSYLKLKYNYVKEPSMSKTYSHLQVATKKSDGSKVLFQTINKDHVLFYTLESTSPFESYSTEIPALYGKHGSARCMSPRPLNLVLPYEVEMHKYLSQDGYGSPHVTRVIDYIVTKKEYILVLEHPGKGWAKLDEYLMKHGKLSVERVRDITKEVVEALLSLRNLGVAHGSIAERNILYNEKTGELKLMNFGYSGPLKKWNQGSSATKPSDEKPDFWSAEKDDIWDIGQFMYHLLTSKDPYNDQAVQKDVAKKLGESLGNSESQLSIDAVDLVTILLNQGPYQMATLENVLKHPFFTSQ